MPRRTFERSTPKTGKLVDIKTGKPIEKPSVPVICERIRHYRELRGIEQKDLARMIGITGNSISNWETGRSRPDINLIPSICNVLQVTLYELFNMEDPSMDLTAGEQILIDSYRQLSRKHQYVVDNLINTLINVEISETCRPIRILQFYDRSLAAGIGDPLEFEDSSTPIYLYGDKVGDRADCVFAVNGDSMEPVYHDGDLVLVERIPDAPDLSDGEIGAFIVRNETYIKKYAEDGLHSLNPAYPVMKFSDEEAVYVIGRVVGILDPADIAAEKDVDRFEAINRRGE